MENLLDKGYSKNLIMLLYHLMSLCHWSLVCIKKLKINKKSLKYSTKLKKNKKK